MKRQPRSPILLGKASVGDRIAITEWGVVIKVEEHAGVPYYDVKFSTAPTREDKE